MNFRILSVPSAEPIKNAVAQFRYKGYIISFSTAFSSGVSVFRDSDGDFSHEVETVEAAIEWINNQ